MNRRVLEIAAAGTVSTIRRWRFPRDPEPSERAFVASDGRLIAAVRTQLRQMRKADRRSAVPHPWPEANPFALDDLLNADSDDLLRQLSDANPA
nr:hypothetical protein [uncultured Rhodopila sp.]